MVPVGLRAVAAAMTMVVAVAGCVEAANAPRSADASAPAPGASGWAADIDAFVAALEARHPEPYHSTSRQEFLRRVAELEAALPEMSEWEARVGFMRLLAHLTSGGRDGHMVLLPEDVDGVPWRMFPLQLYWFSDGIHVVRAAGDLVGAELVAVGDTPVRAAIAAVEEVVTKDNALTVRARVPIVLAMPDVLAALGLVDAQRPVLTFRHEGRLVEVAPDPVTRAEFDAWAPSPHPYVARLPEGEPLYLRGIDRNVWTEYLRGPRALYVAFNAVQPPFDAAAATIRRVLAREDPERVILDLRHNPGGETGLYGPMLDALSEAGDRTRLFALTGRVTFSAAANFLGDLDRATCVVIAGEPPGAAPSFWDDNDPVALPYSGLQASVATRWWDQAGPEHPRTVFEVDLPVRLGSRDYFAGRDPVLAAVLRAPASGCD